MFQSTHPRGVRLLVCPTRSITSRFQSTHPRGVRPVSARILLRLTIVSIHAPTRGATDFCSPFSCCTTVSIHAPTRGATWQSFTSRSVVSQFQSTHPRGVRHNPRSKQYYTSSVSIHAPTRGATAYSAKYRILIYKSSHFANINQTITFKVIKSLEFL